MPVGDVALDWLRPLARRAAPAAARAQPRRAGPGRAAVPRRPRAAARAPAGVGGRPRAATRGRPRRAGQPAHAAALVRDPSARGRRRPAGRPGVARTCEYHHDPAVHPSDRRADPGGLPPGPSAGLTTGGTRRAWATPTGCSRPGSGSSTARSSTGSCSSGAPRCTILAIVIAVVLFILADGIQGDGSRARPDAPRLDRVVDPVRRRPGRPRLDDPALPQPGVRADQSARHPGRGRAQQDVDRQLAREDQRRAS